jgi:hypothetical protein
MRVASTWLLQVTSTDTLSQFLLKAGTALGMEGAQRVFLKYGLRLLTLLVAHVLCVVDRLR